MSSSDAMIRRLIPKWVRDEIVYLWRLLPGGGTHRADRVRLHAEFVLQGIAGLALPHNAGPARTAAALRRLAALVERGDISRLAEGLDPDVEAAA